MKKFFLLCALCASGLTIHADNGALSGKFKINANGDQIVFSQGNLQYVGTWQFAESQWETIGSAQADNNRDLFGWGTGDAPNKISEDNNDYPAYEFVEWGANPITNGGNKANVWRTLTWFEWEYLFVKRDNAGSLCGFACVNGVNGVIILPDNWVLPVGSSFTAAAAQGFVLQGSIYTNANGVNFAFHTYTGEQWEVMEGNGAVFLPCTGYRGGTDLYVHGEQGCYWSASACDQDDSYGIRFNSTTLDPIYNYDRHYGFSVRLVKIAPKEEAINNTSVEMTATKRIVEGQLLIEKNSKTYNAQGVEIR